MNYWKEALEYALDAAGAFGKLTDAEITETAKGLETSAEMEGEATGRINIPHPLNAEIANIKRSHAADVAVLERREDIFKGNIAKRLNVNPRHIGVDPNGDITYSNGRTTIIG